MSNLSVSYLGLTLKTPFIVGSSSLTDSADKIKQLADCGAGAVVLKSLFEEQANYDAGSLLNNGDFPEAADYLSAYIKNHSTDGYLKLIKDAKQTTDIPVIANINCISSGEWVSFAKQVEEAGADAIELNIYSLPTTSEKDALYYEKKYYDIITEVKKVCNLPIAVKIGMHFTNLPAFIHNLYNRGAHAVVLFNRFYAPDIDIDKIEFTPAPVLSSPLEIRNSLRWVGLISSIEKEIEVCASTGIHSSAAAIKQLLAGAKAVQICSVIYKNGPEYLKTLKKELVEWMYKHTFDDIKSFNGRLNYQHIKDPTVFERSQFMKYYSNKK